MWFGGKRVSDITPDEIEDLVRTSAHEDATIEFKQELNWGKDPGGEEFLRDVVSFANADGGYMIIGIAEHDHRASKLHRVPSAVKEAGRLRDLCLQHIQPRIRDLEIAPVTVPACSGDIIVLRIPDSGSRPHMVTCNSNTYFCRRYQDRKRTMSIEELRDVFEQRARTLHPGTPVEFQAKLDELLGVMRANRLAQAAASDSTQDATNAAEVRKIMELRFRGRIGEQPYFRITSAPIDLSRIDLGSLSPEVEQLLKHPPETRENGWTLWPAEAVERTPESLVASGIGDRSITLLNSGHLEYSQPCDDTMFQWGKQMSSDPTPELYPFAVCELPVNFTRLAKEVYDVAKVDSEIVFRMEYVNVSGYVLRPGVPGSLVHMLPFPEVGVRPYAKKDIITADQRRGADFDPDPVAFSLVEEVYRAFGIMRKYIPCFDKERHFDIEVNSFQE